VKLSARNILKGKIVEVKKGQTTAHVRIDIGGPSSHRRSPTRPSTISSFKPASRPTRSSKRPT